MLARTTWIPMLAIILAASGLIGCASEDATLSSPAEVDQPVAREASQPEPESPWSVRGGQPVVRDDETAGPTSPDALVWGTGEGSAAGAAMLGSEIQFNGLYTAISSTGLLSIAWDAPTTNADGSPLDDLAGFTVSYGPSATDLSTDVNVGRVTTVELELPIGPHYLVVRAYDTWGNLSEPSNVIQVEVIAPS